MFANFKRFFSVNDWITNTENKLKQFTEVVEKLSEEDSIKLGRKDPEAYPLFEFISLWMNTCTLKQLLQKCEAIIMACFAKWSLLVFKEILFEN